MKPRHSQGPIPYGITQIQSFSPSDPWLELSHREFHSGVQVWTNTGENIVKAILLTTRAANLGATVYDIEASDLGLIEAVYGPEAAEACRKVLVPVNIPA